MFWFFQYFFPYLFKQDDEEPMQSETTTQPPNQEEIIRIDQEFKEDTIGVIEDNISKRMNGLECLQKIKSRRRY